VAELVVDVVHHFRPILARQRSSGEVVVSSVSAPLRRGAEAKEVVDERYEKLKVIGSGGIGTVHLARQTMLGREVALKEIRELFGFFNEPQRQEIVRRFDDAILNAAKLSHPNIVVVLDANTGREFPYVISEYVGGGNLRRILQHAESIPPELSVKVFLQILHALGHAHGKGVVHRGLKPENILFDAAGNVRLTDFGIARVVERDRSVIQHVYVGMGSVAYMAPELFADPGNTGPQADLYAAGIILYEMLARKLPGRRSPMPTKLHPTLPKIVDDLFDRLTQDERADRYKSVDEVLGDFYQADASKLFLEPRSVVLFLESPIAKLQLRPEAAAEETRDEAPSSAEREDQRGLTLPLEDPGEPTRSAIRPEIGMAAAVLLSAAALAAPASGNTTAPGSVATASLPSGPASLTASLLASVALPPGLSTSPSGTPTDDVPSPDEVDDGALAVDDSDVAEVDDEDGDDRPRRRGKAQRPYSFQQRLKERDK
jgi:serine/threonine-protein kinase